MVIGSCFRHNRNRRAGGQVFKSALLKRHKPCGAEKSARFVEGFNGPQHQHRTKHSRSAVLCQFGSNGVKHKLEHFIAKPGFGSSRYLTLTASMGQNNSCSSEDAASKANESADDSSGASSSLSHTNSSTNDQFTSQRILSGSSAPDASEEDLRKRIAALETENSRISSRLEFETVARTRAEILVREQYVEATGGGVGAMRPIGKISTCFPTRFGTPRQGSLASLTRGVITLDPSVVGGGSLKGLEGFSHVWVVFIFHENTNMHKFVSQKDTIFPSFVRPPQGGGKRVGLFSTRTPHRPNPVGLSLARLHKVDQAKSQVHLRGVDLIDGTPIVDIKPYVPHVDGPNVEEEGPARIPTWVVNPKFETVPVEFADGVREEMIRFVQAGECEWFSKAEGEELIQTLEQVITLDPRGVIHGRGHYKKKNKSNKGGGKIDHGENISETGSENGGGGSSSNSASNNTAEADNKAEALKKNEQPKEHLFRDNFVLDFDALRIAFRPHDERRAIIVHAVELKRTKNPDNQAFQLRSMNNS